MNSKKTSALDDIQKMLALENLQSSLTSKGDSLITNSISRSQLKNKELAFEQLICKMKKALYVPKKRKAVRIPKAIKKSKATCRS